MERIETNYPSDLLFHHITIFAKFYCNNNKKDSLFSDLWAVWISQTMAQALGFSSLKMAVRRLASVAML